MNITEFAKYAGVSKSAVSRYFNNRYLSEEKRELIKKALQETGYSPTRSAKTIKTRITKLVGVILPKLSSDSIARITDGISRVLSEEGFQMLLVNTANDYKKEIEYLNLFRQQNVAGVILLGSVFTERHKMLLSKMNIPVIIAGQSYKGISSVCHDDYGAAYAVTEHLIKKGAKKLACISAIPSDTAVGEMRTKGFSDALSDNGITFDKRMKVIADFSMDSGYERAASLMKLGKKTDAIFCATDTMAAGTMQYLSENNIRIPEDIMVGSVGDSKLSRIISLTTAHLHYTTEGIEAAKMLVSSIYNGDSIPRAMQLDFKLIERRSTDRKCETL